MAKNMQKSYFDVLGLCCSSEIPLIENILGSLDGVKEISVIVTTRTVVVVHDNFIISQLQILKVLNQARLEANVRVHGETSHKKMWPSPYAICSGVLCALSFLSYVYHPLKWLGLGAVAVGIFPITLKALASLRNLRLDVNVLALIAVTGTIAMKDYVEAGFIVFLFTIAQWLESRASHKATAVMESLMSLAPQKAILAESGQEVSVDEVNLNTNIAVKAGEVIPIDGIVVDGTCEVDQKTLTGESFPVPVQKDSSVWAGTINLNGYITVRTTALAEDCVVAKMAKLVEEAQNGKTKAQRFIDKCAQYYTPAVIFISGFIALVPFMFRVHDKTYWFHYALVVLVSACPCALILSTPVATFCALTKAATSGLLIKGGDHLETLANIKFIAFDKTGTITRGEFAVTEFQTLSQDISYQTLVYWVSSIESKSSHPMAAALVDYGRSLSIEPKPENVENFQNFPGEGICGKIEGKDVYIGNKRIALKAGCETEQTSDGKGGRSTGYVYVEGALAAVFYLADTCRTGAAEAIKELKALGIKTAMLTGDNEAAALQAQEELGNVLDHVHADLLPKDKARILTEFKTEGCTAMIGDGLNDAPALATADIGISMGISGSALATETGNVILMSNDLRKIPKAVRLARRAHRKVLVNVSLSISTKVAIIGLAAAGHPFIWAAVLTDVGTCLLVILNSMLLLRGTDNKKSLTNSRRDHKHGCKTKSRHSAHKHGNCCSGKSDHKVGVLPEKCSSVACCEPVSKTCCGDIHQSKDNGHGKCLENSHQGHCSSLQPKKCSSGACCGPISKSCSEGSHRGHSLEVTDHRQGHCKVEDDIHEVDHCKHGSSNAITHDVESQSGCISHSHSNVIEEDNMRENGHCHSICHGKKQHRVHSDNHEHHHHHHHHHHIHEDNAHGHTAIAIPVVEHQVVQHMSNTAMHVDVEHNVEPSNFHVCMSLDNRPVASCCRSYAWECCKKKEHFGAGLTEIITE
ncbi:hypothetical protein ACFE04_009280 [Oxalis oulophora]